jgi:hypothetical protein
MCAVLSKADLTSAVAGVVTDTYASPSQHSCTWGDRQSSSSPHVAMATYLQTSKPSSALGGQMVNIAGRDTLVNSDKGGQGLPASCSAKTAAKTWPNGFGNNASADAADGAKPITVSSTNQLVEEPEVSVYANQPEDQLCQTARTLAAKLWALSRRRPNAPRHFLAPAEGRPTPGAPLLTAQLSAVLALPADYVRTRSIAHRAVIAIARNDCRQLEALLTAFLDVRTHKVLGILFEHFVDLIQKIVQFRLQFFAFFGGCRSRLLGLLLGPARCLFLDLFSFSHSFDLYLSS